jgi:hypothetical protein
MTRRAGADAFDHIVFYLAIVPLLLLSLSLSLSLSRTLARRRPVAL